ncbi:hypothetical protein HPB51_002076 [Rhipicephalus microplus]|uniref:Uncharacterized protein n=1 Tax=Rhipicephalus microplus TaxID=6941 RepID=A0A9J6E555_RHIMP|nr:hypothetical protein HPB51_002076 [Rhipicephalus microplus]
MDALQETPRSPQEQPLIHTDEESATETTQMDVQTWSPQGSSEEVDNVSAGERHDGAAWTEDGWHTVLTRRQKKNQKKNQKNASEAVECNASSSSPPKQGSQVKRRRRTRSRRPLPPLPKDDIKIILRPHKGLAVKDILGYELSTAVIDACHRHFDGGSFMLRVHPGSNIIIVSTPHEHVAKELREITHLNIRGRVHSFNSYVADPEDVLRGIVHGIPSGTSQAELMANLRVRTQGVKIERARMLGSTKTAIITFTGSTLPRRNRSSIEEIVHQRRVVHYLKSQAVPAAAALAHYYDSSLPQPDAPLAEVPPWFKAQASDNQLLTRLRQFTRQVVQQGVVTTIDNSLAVYVDTAIDNCVLHTSIVCPALPETQHTCSYELQAPFPSVVVELPAIRINSNGMGMSQFGSPSSRHDAVVDVREGKGGTAGTADGTRMRYRVQRRLVGRRGQPSSQGRNS